MLPAGLSLRPVRPEDTAIVAGIRTRSTPYAPETADFVEWTWRFKAHDTEGERLLVEQEGRAVGYASAGRRQHDGAPSERWAGVRVDLDPEVASRGLFMALLEEMERRVGEVEVISTAVLEPQADQLGWLEAAGYRRDRVGRWGELDLREREPWLREHLAAARRRMAEQEIEVTTLDRAIAARGESTVLDELYRESSLAERDVPRSGPPHAQTREMFDTHLHEPGMSPDRIFVALDSDGVAGLTMLRFPSAGAPWTAFTFTSRRVRGMGVARALKLECAVQALELGHTRIRTENDAENAPMLHLNEQFGYRQIPGRVRLVKRRTG